MSDAAAPDPASPPPDDSQLSTGQVVRRLLALLAGHRRPVLLGMLLLLAGAGIAIGCPLLLRRAIDVDIATGNMRGLALTCGAFLGLQLALIGVRLWQFVTLERVAQRVIGDLRERLLKRLLDLPVAYHDANPPGKLISRVESDCEQLRLLFNSAVVVVFGNGLLFGLMFVIVTQIDLMLTAVLAVVLPCLLAVVVWFHYAVAPRMLAVREKTAVMTGELTEYIQGASVLQALRLEADSAARLKETNLDLFRERFVVEKRVVLFWNLVLIVEGLGVVAVLGIGGWRVATGLATIGTLLMFIDLLARVFEPVHQLAQQMQSFQQALAGARKIFALLDMPTEADVLGPRSDGDSAPARPAADAPVVAFDDVWFRYKDEWILRGVSFSIPRGQHWALVGVTGGGKSTLVRLLLKYYAPQRGTIRLDGVDLRELSPDEARARVGFVPQELFLFPGSVRDNLALGPVDDAQARAAVVQLGLDDFVDRLPQGWDTPIAERGLNLSAGERQLLCAARAMAGDPPLLVLDEATSAVDPRTERTLQRALSRLRDGRTTLTIAHRLATILESDAILVLERGELVERGSHDDLLASGGHYADLFELQFGALA